MTDRPLESPSAPQAYQCNIIQSTGMATEMKLKVLFGKKSHGRRPEKKQQESRVFLDIIFDVYTHVDNRERARVCD